MELMSETQSFTPVEELSKKKENPEEEPTLKARTRLAEILKPPEKEAEKIKSAVTKAASEILEAHPDPDMKRIVEHATGIFLWEKMVFDTGKTLPVGLAIKFQNDSYPFLQLDNRLLSNEEYFFFIKELEQKGVTKKVDMVQQQHRREHQEELAQTMEDFLRHSSLATYFESFTTPQQKEIAPRDLSQREEAAMRADLEGKFKTRWAPALGGRELHTAMKMDPTMAIDYDTQVSRRISMASVDKAPTYATGRKKKNAGREQFVKRIKDCFSNRHITGSYQPEILENLFAKDGAFWSRHSRDGEAFKLDTWNWDRITDHEIWPISDGSYLAEPHYAAKGLEIMGPLLFDRSDTRDLTAIIEDGYGIAAKKIAKQFVEESSESDFFERLTPKNRTLWLSQADGPLVTPKDYDHFDPAEKEYNNQKDSFHSLDSAAEIFWQHQEELAKVHYARPEILTDSPQQLQRKGRNLDLPIFPKQHTDLILDISGHRVTPHSRTESPETYDPFIQGMRLVARNGTRCYFEKDPEGMKVFEPIHEEIKYIRRLKIADFCQEIGMKPLAERISSHKDLTVDQLMNLLKDYVQYAIPDKESPLPLRTTSDWKTLVNDQGILQGQSDTFATFAADILNICYPRNGYIYGFASSQTKSLFYKGKAEATTHAVTRLRFPEGIEKIIDISPDPTQLHELAASLPHKPRNTEEENDNPIVLHSGNERYLHVLPAKEYKELRDQHVGKILFAEPKVFADVNQRLFSKVSRNDTLPTPDTLTAEQFDAVVLRIQSNDNALADQTHDPFIAGMKLVAKDGNQYDFILDPESTEYKPVQLIIPRQKRNDIALFCEKIGMSGLNGLVKNQENLTVEGLRQLVRWHIKGVIKNEGNIYRINHAEDLAQLVNDEGILEGQCEAPEFFMNTLLTKIYGSQAVKTEGGMTLKNTAAISRMGHAQTRLTLPEHNINTLIDVEPALSDINLDEEKPITESYKPSLEELLEQITHMSSTHSMIEASSLQNTSYPTEILQDKEEGEKKEDKEKQTIKDTDEKKEKFEAEKKKTPETPSQKKDLINPQTTIKDETKAEITIPTPTEPEQTATEILEEKKVDRHLYATLSNFELELPLFLGMDHAYSDEGAYHRAVMKKLLPTLQKSKDTWQSTPHVQLYIITKKYKEWERHKNWSEGETFSYPAEDIDRLQRMIGHYKNRSSKLWTMVRQGKFPNYDPQFLQTMEKAVNAFAAWGTSRKKIST